MILAVAIGLVVFPSSFIVIISVLFIRQAVLGQPSFIVYAYAVQPYAVAAFLPVFVFAAVYILPPVVYADALAVHLARRVIGAEVDHLIFVHAHEIILNRLVFKEAHRRIIAALGSIAEHQQYRNLRRHIIAGLFHPYRIPCVAVFACVKVGITQFIHCPLIIRGKLGGFLEYAYGIHRPAYRSVRMTQAVPSLVIVGLYLYNRLVQQYGLLIIARIA